MTRFNRFVFLLLSLLSLPNGLQAQIGLTGLRIRDLPANPSPSLLDYLVEAGVGANTYKITINELLSLRTISCIAPLSCGGSSSHTLGGDFTLSITGGVGPGTSKYIVQGTSDAALTGAQFLGVLGTGIVKNTMTTGVLSIASAGDFPTLPYVQLSTDLGHTEDAPWVLVTHLIQPLSVAQGGLNLAAASDDNMPVGNGTTWQSKAIPSCSDSSGQHLNYTTATNTFSCGTSFPAPVLTPDASENLAGGYIDFSSAVSVSSPSTGIRRLLVDPGLGVLSVRDSLGFYHSVEEINPITVKYKATDESVASSTTLQDDDDLQVVASGGIYSVVGYIPVDVTAGGIKMTVGGTATYIKMSLTLKMWSGFTTSPGTVNTTGFLVTAGGGPIQTTSPIDLVEISGTFQIGGSGTVIIRWAQRTSSGTATKVLAGSLLTLTRLD